MRLLARRLLAVRQRTMSLISYFELFLTVSFSDRFTQGGTLLASDSQRRGAPTLLVKLLPDLFPESSESFYSGEYTRHIHVIYSSYTRQNPTNRPLLFGLFCDGICWLEQVVSGYGPLGRSLR